MIVEIGYGRMNAMLEIGYEMVDAMLLMSQNDATENSIDGLA
jgi:hypothetical protein